MSDERKDYHLSEFHSVSLHEENCKGCTICVTSCPVEAIRVQNGKAVILEDRCIDCGECIRICPSRAKYAKDSTSQDIEKFTEKIILTSPSFYAQFSSDYSISLIDEALKKLGFSKVIRVGQSALEISDISAKYFLANNSIKKPLISSSCPAIIKLIQIRFPDLINNLLPIIPPVEFAARKAKIDNPNAGIFFVSPCPAKITVIRSPLGYEKSTIDGAIATNSLIVQILSVIKKIDCDCLTYSDKDSNTDWASSTGEAICLEQRIKTYNPKYKFTWLSASGLKNVIDVLEQAEDGKLDDYEFIELNSCSGGCLGGSLNANSVPISEGILRQRNKDICSLDKNNSFEQFSNQNNNVSYKNDLEDSLWSSDLSPRPMRLLHPVFSQAKKMMDQIESVRKELPGLDCGSCGAPNCNALAEDIVRKKAKKEDCVTILKKQYEKIIFGQNFHD